MRHWALLFSLGCFLLPNIAGAWGFEPHRRINQHACLILPSPLYGFYKTHLSYMMQHATDADMRRYVDTLEAGKHFIDVEHYGFDVDSIPNDYLEAEKQFGKSHLQNEGNLPWNIIRCVYGLKKAFSEGQIPYILKVSADLGHYVADAHVPLHTTENYNGQLTGQKGIHGLWETRIPELFMDTLLVPLTPMEFHENWVGEIWSTIKNSHQLVPMVLSKELETRSRIPENQWYGFEQRKNKVEKTYSQTYVNGYYMLLNGMVETQFISSAQLLAQLIFTAWVMAGEPDLSKLNTIDTTAQNPNSGVLQEDLNCDH